MQVLSHASEHLWGRPVSWVLRKCLPIASWEGFGVFLNFPRAKPILQCHCKSCGSSLRVPMLLSGETKLSLPSGNPCLAQWRLSFSLYCLAVPFSILQQYMQYLPLTLNKWIKPFCNLPEVIRFFWLSCLQMDLKVRYMLWLPWCCTARHPGSHPVGGCITATYKMTSSSAGFFMAVEIFEQISREQRPCWQFWFTGWMAAGRGVLKSPLIKEDVVS